MSGAGGNVSRSICQGLILLRIVSAYTVSITCVPTFVKYMNKCVHIAYLVLYVTKMDVCTAVHRYILIVN